MSRIRVLSFGVVLLLAADGALQAQGVATTGAAYGARPATAMSLLPMNTASTAARAHAALGQRALDMQHPREAAEHFREAVAADSSFAFGHLGLANSSTSLGEFTTNLRTASRFAGKASRAEQLLIGIGQKILDADLQGAAALARELVKVAPSNPRSHLVLANVLQQLGRETEARQEMERAIALAPKFAPSYIQLGYSYLLASPRAPARAEAVIKKAVALEPEEPLPYIVLGSFGRATNQLEQARLAYTSAARVDPANALAVQQRGHVNAFLGDYDAARADYDAAIRLGRNNEPATYGVFRTRVSVYAGQPKEAIAELERFLAAVDTMSIPDRDGARLFALSDQALIASHVGAFDEARRALDRRTAVLRKLADQVGTAEFRRTQEADIAYNDGLLALRQGDFAAATAKAREAMRLVAENGNPRKDEPAHALLGFVALGQKQYAEAVKHFEAADPNDMYVAYHRALALEGVGRGGEAKKIFRDVATYNFSNAGPALVRADAKARAE